MNYYEKFSKLLNGDINRLIELAHGHDEAKKAINDVYSQIEKNLQPGEDFDFDQVFSDCLAKNNELWFNIGWSAGWSAGAVRILKLLEADDPKFEDLKTILAEKS